MSVYTKPQKCLSDILESPGKSGKFVALRTRPFEIRPPHFVHVLDSVSRLRFGAIKHFLIDRSPFSSLYSYFLGFIETPEREYECWARKPSSVDPTNLSSGLRVLISPYSKHIQRCEQHCLLAWVLERILDFQVSGLFRTFPDFWENTDPLLWFAWNVIKSKHRTDTCLLSPWEHLGTPLQ